MFNLRIVEVNACNIFFHETICFSVSLVVIRACERSGSVNLVSRMRYKSRLYEHLQFKVFPGYNTPEAQTPLNGERRGRRHRAKK
jgi:hypothetical protein